MFYFVNIYRRAKEMLVSVTVIVTVCAALANGECTSCSIPTLLYDDLMCSPKYLESNQCCPVEYDCSNIYNRPKGTCHFKGKYFQPGEKPKNEDIGSFCEHSLCECKASGNFDCAIASDSCAEFWVPNYVKPNCYLTYEQNRCCHVDQKCPPFDENAVKCEVNGKTYRQGEKFESPLQKCTKCICDVGFNGKFNSPYCQRYNCTSELFHSEKINNFCAPVYLNWDDCCPRRWICPSESGTYSLPTAIRPTNSPKCRFGNKMMVIGEKYNFERYECECVIPPFLTCKY